VTTTSAPDLARAAQLFHALSDETRLGILGMLRSGEQCVCDLQASFDAAQSRLSYHLKVLKAAGLVIDRQEGRWSYYSMVPNILGEAHDVIRLLATEQFSERLEPLAPSNRKPLKVLGTCCS